MTIADAALGRNLAVDGELSLPPEITQHIFSLLKTDSAPSVLAKLVRCSKALCDELSPTLYKRLPLDQSNAIKLAYGLDVPSSCSTKFTDAPKLPPHPEDLLRLQTDRRLLMELSPRERKLKLLGYTEGDRLARCRGLMGLNRIVVTYQTLDGCWGCAKFHRILLSLSTITIRSSALESLARTFFASSPYAEDRKHSGAFDAGRRVYDYSELYDMLTNAFSPRHIVMESHIWSLTPVQLGAPPAEDLLLEKGLEAVMRNLATEWVGLDTMEIKELVGIETLPDPEPDPFRMTPRASDEYTVHYASQERLDTASPEVLEKISRGPTGKAVLFSERSTHLRRMFARYEDNEDLNIDDFYPYYGDQDQDGVRNDDETVAALRASGVEHDGYKTIFEILNDPELGEGVDPDEWMKQITGNPAFAAKMVGKVRFVSVERDK